MHSYICIYKTIQIFKFSIQCGICFTSVYNAPFLLIEIIFVSEIYFRFYKKKKLQENNFQMKIMTVNKTKKNRRNEEM